MNRVAVATDSNSGITQEAAKELGISVLPMPFFINGEEFFEDITLTQEEFYQKLAAGAEISTSQPSITAITQLWDKLLEDHEEVVFIPMSSGLSSTCATATMLAQDYGDKVQVVNNQRISITQRQSALDALEMVRRGMSAAEIREFLERTKFDSSIYITLDTLKYLKKGGRITPAAAALGTLLKIKPVLQIQGEKLDAFAKCRTLKAAKKTMIEAIQKDCANRFGANEDASNMVIQLAYSGEDTEVKKFLAEVQEVYPWHDIYVAPLSLSVSCHIGPGSVAIACAKKLPDQI